MHEARRGKEMKGEKKRKGSIPGGPAAKTPHSPYMGPGIDPWSGSQIPHAATKCLHAQLKKRVFFLIEKSYRPQ